jgi:hypothetical protein
VGSSYVVLWDNGSQSVEWSWTAANAQLAVGHLPIPPKPPLDYEPKAYRDFDDRGWVGKYSWRNVKEHATPLAGAGVETGGGVYATGDVADKAASGGCVSRLVGHFDFWLHWRESSPNWSEDAAGRSGRGLIC